MLQNLNMITSLLTFYYIMHTAKFEIIIKDFSLFCEQNSFLYYFGQIFFVDNYVFTIRIIFQEMKVFKVKFCKLYVRRDRTYFCFYTLLI